MYTRGGRRAARRVLYVACCASAMSAAPDQNYTSFPAVKTEELLSVLHELGLGVTAEDIAKPQGAMVQKVYMAFLDTLAGTMPDTLEKQRDDICRDMDHKVRLSRMLISQDVFEDGVAWLLFFREVYV